MLLVLVRVWLAVMAFITPQTVIQPTAIATTIVAMPTVAPTPSPKPVPLGGFCERIPILMYHHTETTTEVKISGQSSLNVTAAWFDKQMSYLKSRGYNFLTMTQVADSLITKTKLGVKPVVVTLDDGYEDVYQNAFPVIKKYGVSIDFEIPTGLVNNPGYVTWDQLREMQSSGLVHIYNHSWSHANLATTKNKIIYEVTTAQTQLQENLGVTAKIVTYPYGSFNSLTIQTVKELGYVAALTTITGQIQCDSFIMSLHRTRVGNTQLSFYGL